MIAWRLPLVAPLAWILYLPGITHLGRRVYRHIADNRVRQGCGDDGCPIPIRVDLRPSRTNYFKRSGTALLAM